VHRSAICRHNGTRDSACDKAKLSPACGRRGPFHGGKGPKTPCAGRAQAQLLLRLCPALLAECGPAPTRTSLCSVAARHRSLRSLRLHVAAARLARSNSGALLPHSAAMLGALYGALSHCARASMRYVPAFPFHLTAAIHCRTSTPSHGVTTVPGFGLAASTRATTAGGFARDFVARVIAAQRRNPGRIASAKPEAHRVGGTDINARLSFCVLCGPGLYAFPVPPWSRVPIRAPQTRKAR